MKLSSIVAVAVFVIILFSMLVYDHSSEENSQTNSDKVTAPRVRKFFPFNRAKGSADPELDKDATSIATVDATSPVKLITNELPLSVIKSEPIAKIEKPASIIAVKPEDSTIPAIKSIDQTAAVSAVLQRNQSCRETIDLKCDMYPYVKFWNRRLFPEDCYKSPLTHPLGLLGPVEEQKYVVFQPDGGGWNNIRMAAEVAMLFAHVTGRVLVMPPITQWYLLTKSKVEEDNLSTFQKFFDLDRISEALNTISMEQFILTVAAKGLLKELPPPHMSVSEKKLKHFARHHSGLWDYLKAACYLREWQPGRNYMGFNVTAGTSDKSDSDGRSVDALTGAVFNPIEESAHTREFASHKRKLVLYDKAMHSEKAIYFPGDYSEEYRLLTHFYTYLHFADEHIEHVYKRIVRDRLHYHDVIFCAAGRVVKQLHIDAAALAAQAMQNEGRRQLQGQGQAGEEINTAAAGREGGRVVMEKARDVVQPESGYNKRTGGGNTNYNAVYHAAHIRRGDFQYAETQLTAEEIYANINHLFNRSVTKLLYISTDERNKTFFEPFREYFTVKFFDDYEVSSKVGEGHLSRNHVGMVEQTICASAHTFVGTPLSTFTGYITRMRGYYRDNRYSRTFYTMKPQMYQLQQRPNVEGPFWAREFATAHADIDDIINDIES